MTDSGGFVKVPTDEEAKRMEEAARKSQEKREQARKEREEREAAEVAREVLPLKTPSSDRGVLLFLWNSIHLHRLDSLIGIEGVSCGKRQHLSVARARTGRSRMMGYPVS